jgi:uncharacterized protein (TIGR00268 family)
VWIRACWPLSPDEHRGSKCWPFWPILQSLPQRTHPGCQVRSDYSIPLHIQTTTEFTNPDFIANPHNRCYYCKRDIFTHITDLAKFEGLRYVLDGQNADDINDYRPGSIAARELGVRSPFLELGVTKKQIRELSKELGLPTARKPSMACLSSRIPFGYAITLEKLKMIEEAEAFPSSWGLRSSGSGTMKSPPVLWPVWKSAPPSCSSSAPILHSLARLPRR